MSILPSVRPLLDCDPQPPPTDPSVQAVSLANSAISVGGSTTGWITISSIPAALHGGEAGKDVVPRAGRRCRRQAGVLRRATPGPGAAPLRRAYGATTRRGHR